MQTWTVVALLLCAALAIAWHLSYTAARLDRLHARVQGSLAALDAQLVRRADAALDWARTAELDPASAMLVATCAVACLQEAEGARITEDVQEHGVEGDRAAAETALTECLSVVLAQQDEQGDEAARDDEVADARRRLADACDRVDLAVRFHDEAVRDVRRVRAKPVVRLTHLAGHTALPELLEFSAHVDGASSSSAWR